MAKASGKGKPGGGARNLKIRLRTARGRTVSSQNWLARQLNDPFVAAAKKAGYRSRAAFKLLQIDEQYHLLKPGMRVIDLGAAPGGWSQVAAERVRAGREGGGLVVAMDISEMEPIADVTILQADFMDDDAPAKLKEATGGGLVDGVLTDMAAPATGHKQTDHLRIMALCEAAAVFAGEVLKPGGFFLAKVLQGGADRDLLAILKRDFATVRHVKPKASRSDSSELYLLATCFRGDRSGTLGDTR